MLDEIYSISTETTCNWIPREEFKRLKRYLYDGEPLDSNDFVSILRLDGGETVLRVGAIVCMDHTTAEQREYRRKNTEEFEKEGEVL